MKPFGLDHFGAVAVVVMAIVALVAWGRTVSSRSRERVGRVIGVLLVVHFAVDTGMRAAMLHYPWKELLPLHLCGALVFIGCGAFWSTNIWLRDAFCFWTFGATLHSLITPTSPAPFPDVRYLSYFSGHGLLVVAAAYLVLVMGHGTTWRSAARAFIALNAFTTVVAPLNLLLDTNFLYLRSKPPSPTLFDVLGPWPAYILSLEVVAVGSFALWTGVFRLTGRAASTLDASER
ncbi:MAG: TIGR02206 family membrane protein [Myxococcaceae bacterium]